MWNNLQILFVAFANLISSSMGDLSRISAHVDRQRLRGMWPATQVDAVRVVTLRVAVLHRVLLRSADEMFWCKCRNQDENMKFWDVSRLRVERFLLFFVVYVDLCGTQLVINVRNQVSY